MGDARDERRADLVLEGGGVKLSPRQPSVRARTIFLAHWDFAAYVRNHREVTR